MLQYVVYVREAQSYSSHLSSQLSSVVSAAKDLRYSSI